MPKKTQCMCVEFGTGEGSGVWWIRYRAEGVLKREKVGTKKTPAKRKADKPDGTATPSPTAAQSCAA